MGGDGRCNFFSPCFTSKAFFSPLLLTSSFYLSRELPLCSMMSYNFKRDKQVYLAEHTVVCRAI